MNKVNITQLMLMLDTFFSPKDLHSKIQVPGWPAKQRWWNGQMKYTFICDSLFPWMMHQTKEPNDQQNSKKITNVL